MGEYTRVGPWLWNIDLVGMDDAELDALAGIVEYHQKMRQLKAEAMEQTEATLKQGERDGLHLMYTSDDGDINVDLNVALANGNLYWEEQ